MRIPDSKVAQLAALVDETGIIELIDAELAGRPGPAGLPVRTVLIGLLLAVHYTGKATLAEAWRLLAFSLSPNTHPHLGLETIPDDEHARLAFSRRIYRAFDRLTTALDPARADRRSRLPQAEADQLAAAWEDTDPEHTRRRDLLQNIVNRLVLAPVRHAIARGHLAHYTGDIGIDTTAIATWARPPQPRKHLASVEITAGWHYSAGSDDPTFGYSATLPVAACRRPGKTIRGRPTTHPQLAFGLVIDTPGKRIGPNAITTLTALDPLDLPQGLLAVDRAYTDQTPEHFARPARALGYQLVLDYKQHQRGVQGSVHGAPMIDGNLACPATPTTLAHATTGLDDQTVRTPTDQLTALIAAREFYYLKLKQSPDSRGAIRLQCPAAGTSPALNCPRFNRLHPKSDTQPARPAAVDLADLRKRAAHPAARPTVVLPPGEALHPPPADQLPRICRQTTITVAHDDLGKLGKFQQETHYLTDRWQAAYKPIRAHNEGLNGRLKGHHIDLADPKNRLAHGRVAQTILAALMICIANQQIITAWRQTTNQQPRSPQPGDTFAAHRAHSTTDASIPTRGRPPPSQR